MNPLLDKAKAYLPSIGESVIDLLVSLMVMIFIARIYGQRGLGIFSYLLSLLLVTGYLSELGIPKYVERETAVHHGHASQQFMIYADARKSIVITGIIACPLFWGGRCNDGDHAGLFFAFWEHVAQTDSIEKRSVLISWGRCVFDICNTPWIKDRFYDEYFISPFSGFFIILEHWFYFIPRFTSRFT
jgi:hypothetical protein